MYEDAWFSNFVPQRQPSQSKKSTHHRRESLLKQPEEEAQADIPAVESIVEDFDDPNQSTGPPAATLERRAQSYSDFYNVAREFVRKERDGLLEEDNGKSEKPLQNDVEFERWYSSIGTDLLEAGHEEYRVYRDQLQLTGNHLDALQESTTSALDLLSSLSDAFKAVEAQTSNFRTQCEGLLAEQKRINSLADDIGHNLQFYAYLDPITRRLNAPGAGNFVRGQEFSEMLENLDACIEYMQNHPNQREAATYRSRYRLLLTRALTLIRVHFTNALREIAADVARRIADRQLNETTMSALLYAKFRVPAIELKQVGLQIAKRAIPPAGAEQGTEAEYQSLMNELYQSYSTTRGRLILPLITKKMQEIALAPSTSKDLVAFARTAINYVRSICVDEYDLWREWFDNEGGLYDFLESMCEPMFDHLRPKTIHETQLLKLCELCTLIQTRYMEREEEDDDEEEDIVQTPKLNFAALVAPALEDAQARLIFLSMAILRADIESYKPKPEDLDWPARARQRASSVGTKAVKPVLSGRKNSNPPQTPKTPKTPAVVDEEGTDPSFSFRQSNHEWYPTLRKAVWLLSRIYRLVNSSIFDDLAHQIVHQTTLSLVSASATISKQASPSDGNLFLLKHLLLLKQQIVAFDVEFVSSEVNIDFNSFTSTFWELRERGGLFDPRNWGRMLIPTIVRDMRDAKGELDGRLRKVINDFTQSFADRMCAALPKAEATSKESKKTGDPTAVVDKVRKAIEKDVPFLRKKLDEYIEDQRTRETLVAAVMDVTVQAYEDWFDRQAATSPSGKKTKGKGREDEAWDPDVFAEWCSSVFGVSETGAVGLGIMGRHDDDDSMSVGSGVSRTDST